MKTNIKILFTMLIASFTLGACTSSDIIIVDEKVDAKIVLSELGQGEYAFVLGLNVNVNQEVYEAGYERHTVNTNKFNFTEHRKALEGECKWIEGYSSNICVLILESDIDELENSSAEIEYYTKEGELIAKQEVFLNDYLE